ncbi:glycosyl hydrolase family 28 protein [Clostridium sp. MCC353]|uniref:glycosyl hydrolase family 28 protein n=1 Tax=Clostridium sp. MCC353 TaxID=2592646 RepID=UPI001C013FF3|nr:glycosyl hydrolase family 28 protein [Clostridium sp. MCC353]
MNIPIKKMTAAPKYCQNQGSFQVTGLQVPVLAYDHTSITLVWQKPENYQSIADYAVTINGQAAGTARENFKKHADWAHTYMDAFYQYYKKRNIDMVNVDIHSFKAAGLAPDTSYHFEVTALDSKGGRLGEPASINWKTTPVPDTFNIVDYGAKPVFGGFTSYDEETSRFIESNTKSIQSAIDHCTAGGRVVIPNGIWMSGALYLHSSMTLELEEGAVLLGSPNADHYDRNYLLYPYSTDTRSWALINAYSSDEKMPLSNIRIVGKGTISGNGWKYGAGDEIAGSGFSPAYQSLLPGDPEDPRYLLKQWVCGTNAKVYSASSPESSYGILAADASMKSQKNGLDAARAYSTRPNLIVIRGAENIYIEGITAENPAFHTIAILDSKNAAAENVKYITYDANNADGIELGNTSDALVYNCFFDTGDDSINFATGLGKGVSDAGQQPSRNIWAFNNFLRHGHGGAIAAGSHTGAGICDMLVEDNVLNHSNIPFRFKSAPVNGGGVWNVLIRDCAVGNVMQLFVMSTIYNDNNQTLTVEPADKPAEFHDIHAYNITADGISQNTFCLTADVRYEEPWRPWHTHHDLYFQDITVTGISPDLDKKAETITGVENAVFYNVKVDKNLHPWSQIACSKNLSFYNCDPSPAADDAINPPKWDEKLSFLKAIPQNSTGTDAVISLTWNGADDKATGYIIETYLSGHEKFPVDITPPVKGVKNHILSGLCHNTDYIFKIYAVSATGYKTEGPSCRIRIETKNENSGFVPLNPPADLNVTYQKAGYTWAVASFENAVKSDPRIRGYRCFVSGIPVKTVYNYQLSGSRTDDSLKLLVGRMTNSEQTVRLTAFSDDGQTLSYSTEVLEFPQKYYFKSPVWTSGLDVIRDHNSLVLSWNEPEDESGIYAYRVYMDGKPIYRNPTDYFNPVNGKYTTKSTTLTLDNMDVYTDHTFKVEAAGAWRKSLAGEAPFHWTYSGPETFYHGLAMK